MESEKKSRKDIEKYLSSGVEYLKALDFEIGEERKYEVLGEEDVQFDEEDPVKAMLILKGIDLEKHGLVLNRTNLNFLKDKGYVDFDELERKTLTLKKEERLFEGKFGKRKNTGLFVTKVE